MNASIPRHILGAVPSPAARCGRVSLVGAGPGDADLLTLRAARRIAEACVVVYDNLVGSGVVAMIPKHAERIFVGKESGNHSLPQEAITRLLVDTARRGRDVVRLKGGDPFVFGRGGEEMLALLDAGIDVEIVPGITAALGASAATGIPLTHRELAQSCVFVTGHRQGDLLDLDWPALARPHQTVVIYMGVAALAMIAEQLTRHGLPATTPVAVIRRATLPDQRELVATLGTIARRAVESGMRAPALIVVGAVVGLARSARRDAGATALPAG